MMKRIGLVLAWLVVAAGLSGVAYQIVAAAESQVSDQALTPIVAITSSTVGTDTTQDSTATSTTEQSNITAATSSTSSTTSTTVGSTSTSAPSSTTTTTPPSTTTTVAAAWTSRTIPSKGGEVVIQYRPGEVRLVAARPAPGYRVEVETAGPPEVEVEFENEATEAKTEVKARWRNGALEVIVEG